MWNVYLQSEGGSQLAAEISTNLGICGLLKLDKGLLRVQHNLTAVLADCWMLLVFRLQLFSSLVTNIYVFSCLP